MNTSTLKTDLDSIWKQRWNQQIDSALKELSNFQFERSWNELSPSRLPEPPASIEYLECLLLKASIMRAQGSYGESSRWIGKIIKLQKQYGIEDTFSLHFEAGLDHWCHEDVRSALDSFLASERFAKSPIQKVLAKSNVLFCLESLDLSRGLVEEQLGKALAGLSPDQVEHVRQQWTAYLLRKEFYLGRFNFEYENSDQIGQPEFFLNYISLLPYMNDRLPSKFQSLLDKKKYLWQGSYRLRTLEGLFLPIDKEPIRQGDVIDRSYLWIWFFMASEKDMSLGKVHLVLKSLRSIFDLKILSVENKLLLRNTLAWLKILSPNSMGDFSALGRQLQRINGENYPLLESEYVFSQAVQMLIANQSTKSLEIYSPFDSLWKALVKGTRKDLPNLFDILEPLRASSKEVVEDLLFVVNISNQTLENRTENRRIRSRQLCRLFLLAKDKQMVKIEDLGEEFVQYRRNLYNLLARARRFDPTAYFEIDGLFVRCRLETQNYMFVGVSDSPKSNGSSEIIGLDRREISAADMASPSALKLIFPKRFRRRDIEKVLSLSKTSANRVVQSWLNKEIILRCGNGREIYYAWT